MAELSLKMKNYGSSFCLVSSQLNSYMASVWHLRQPTSMSTVRFAVLLKVLYICWHHCAKTHVQSHAVQTNMFPIRQQVTGTRHYHLITFTARTGLCRCISGSEQHRPTDKLSIHLIMLICARKRHSATNHGTNNVHQPRQTTCTNNARPRSALILTVS